MVRGFGFRVYGLGVRVSGFRVWGSGLSVLGLVGISLDELPVSGRMFRD